jgi:hypothetical protein
MPQVNTLFAVSPPGPASASVVRAPAEPGRGGCTHSYLWRQVFFTEPIGQWLCAGGHSFGWSIRRSDAGVMGRVERRRS